MGKYCSTYGCSNTNAKLKKKAGVSFFRFPLKRPDILKQWITKIKRENFVPTQYSFICLEHFIEPDFKYQNFTERRELKEEAVPSIFSFVTPTKERPRNSYVFGNGICTKDEPSPPSHNSVAVQTDLSLSPPQVAVWTWQ
ncbi:THAP domain-containing protein 1 [Plakobranchus ocellatus]|uniref:THAP domain-containing protein 1 n=1 Tax=Plakobranchus ocellatus TaxID=259542 RepID=A0AAV4A0Z1_9GAST|nr:THAP domain-containing protein 1 [Plakobranchus ocellatus]